MKFTVHVSICAVATASSLVNAVAITTFDNWLPDSVYASWPNGTLSMNETNFGVTATGFGGGYANIIPNVDGTGANTVRLEASVNAGVAGFLVALGDTTGHEWNYAWYGNVPGGGVNGSNDYVFTKPIGSFNFSTGAAGQLDVANIDYIHIQVDPGFNPNLQYQVTYNDLSVIIGSANLTWNNTGGTGDGSTWDIGTSQNWNNGTAPATYHDGDTVSFTNANNGHSNVTLNTIVSPASTTVNSSAAYVISGTGGIAGPGGLSVQGTGSLTLNTANTYAGATTVNAGSTLNVNGSIPATALAANGNVVFGANAGTGILVRNQASITLASGGTVGIAAPSAATNRTVLVAGALTFGGTTAAPQGTLDLGANDMIVRGASADVIRSLLKAGKSGLAGIMSSAGAATTTDKKALGYAQVTAAGNFDGQSVANGDVIVKYTLVGDTDLNGNVNFDDLLALAQHYGSTSTTWSGGDFTYDGTTNFDDLLALAQNYSKTALNSTQQSALGASFSADFALAMSLVPEPASISALSLAGLSVLRRRRLS